jgi:hypothetical protein
MARPERFELPTFWFVARHSIQLSYGRVFEINMLRVFLTSRYPIGAMRRSRILTLRVWITQCFRFAVSGNSRFSFRNLAMFRGLDTERIGQIRHCVAPLLCAAAWVLSSCQALLNPQSAPESFSLARSLTARAWVLLQATLPDGDSDLWFVPSRPRLLPDAVKRWFSAVA